MTGPGHGGTASCDPGAGRQVVPLELWDLEVDGRPLQAWRHHPSFPVRVAAMVVAARTAHRPDLLGAVTHVHLGGGGASAAMAAALEERGLSCTWSADPFAPARAGARLHGACLDVGQTSLKQVILHRPAGPVEGRRRIERDLLRAPYKGQVPADRRAAARQSTLDFLAEALRQAGVPSLLLALPCELHDGVAGPCSYCWDDPDPRLLTQLSERSGVELSAINDAGLAALAVPDAVADAPGPTLVLTVGFGVGAALLLPSGDRELR